MCLPTSLILSETLLFKYFSLYVYPEGNFDFANRFQQYDIIMTSDYVIMSIKLYPEVGNDEYIIVCNLQFWRP